MFNACFVFWCILVMSRMRRQKSRTVKKRTTAKRTTNSKTKADINPVQKWILQW